MTLQKLIKETVDRIYDAFEVSRNIPIDLDELLNNLEIQLQEDSELIFEGKIEKHHCDTILSIKHHRDEERRRFAIAHTLGHYFLHFSDDDKEFKDSVFYRNLDYNNEEVEANEFALNLLMPEEEYKKYAENNAYNFKNNTCDVRKIAEYFKVPKQIAVYRGKSLKIFK